MMCVTRQGGVKIPLILEFFVPRPLFTAMNVRLLDCTTIEMEYYLEQQNISKYTICNPVIENSHLETTGIKCNSVPILIYQSTQLQLQLLI